RGLVFRADGEEALEVPAALRVDAVSRDPQRRARGCGSAHAGPLVHLGQLGAGAGRIGEERPVGIGEVPTTHQRVPGALDDAGDALFTELREHRAPVGAFHVRRLQTVRKVDDVLGAGDEVFEAPVRYREDQLTRKTRGGQAIAPGRAVMERAVVRERRTQPERLYVTATPGPLAPVDEITLCER